MLEFCSCSREQQCYLLICISSLHGHHPPTHNCNHQCQGHFRYLVWFLAWLPKSHSREVNSDSATHSLAILSPNPKTGSSWIPRIEPEERAVRSLKNPQIPHAEEVSISLGLYTQVVALLYYLTSYFPGGAQGMKFMLSMFSTAIVNGASSLTKMVMK